MSLPIRRSTEVLREHMKIDGRTVLDVGCGRGALVDWMRKYGAFAIGLDPQFKLLTAPAIQGLGNTLPLADKSFDTVLFFNSLHHVPIDEMAAAMGEAARVAKDTVIIVEPVAQGSHFLAVQPLDDETEIRAAAYSALQNAPELQMLSETTWQIDYIEKSVEELIASMIRVDPAREAKIPAIRVELEERFFHYGREVEGGFAFDQPMRLNALKPKS